MKKQIALLLLTVTILSFSACNPNTDSASQSSEMAIAQQDSSQSTISSNKTSSRAESKSESNTSVKQYKSIDDAELAMQLVIKDCEYKAMQSIVNVFGQIEIGDMGGYSFDYFTNEGKKGYDFYSKWAKDKKLESAAITNGVKSGYLENENRIITNTWFEYTDSNARTTFEIVFIKQGDKWLIDFIGLDS